MWIVLFRCQVKLQYGFTNLQLPGDLTRVQNQILVGPHLKSGPTF